MFYKTLDKALWTTGTETIFRVKNMVHVFMREGGRVEKEKQNLKASGGSGEAHIRSHTPVGGNCEIIDVLSPGISSRLSLQCRVPVDAIYPV